MASQKRKSDPGLKTQLAETGHRYEFFSAVQALQRLKNTGVRIGEMGPYAQEPVRFRHSMALQFHASDIEEISLPEQGPAELTSTFLGLYGAASPLAIHFSEDVIRAESEDEPTLRAFYDLFHHRLISLYFRAWKKYSFPANFRLKQEDESIKRLLCMIGVDGFGAGAESGLSRLEVLELAPLLAMRARPPRVLSLALKRLLPGVNLEIQPFVERKAKLNRDDRMQLGRRSNRLGEDFTLGAHVKDRSARFRVVLGPLDYEACEELMPGGSKYPVLQRIIQQFTRGTLECEVDVLLKKQEVPGYTLAKTRGASLGINTRLGGHHSEKSGRMRVLLTDNPDDARAVLIDESTRDSAA